MISFTWRQVGAFLLGFAFVAGAAAFAQTEAASSAVQFFQRAVLDLTRGGTIGGGTTINGDLQVNGDAGVAGNFFVGGFTRAQDAGVHNIVQSGDHFVAGYSGLQDAGASNLILSGDLTVADDMSADDGTFATVTFSGGGTPCFTRGGNTTIQTCVGDGFASLGTLQGQASADILGGIRNTGNGANCSGATDDVCIEEDLAGSSSGTTGWTISAAGVAVFNTSARVAFTTLGTCAAGVEGALRLDTLSGIATGAATRLCLCRSDGASTYTWINVVTGSNGTSTACAP